MFTSFLVAGSIIRTAFEGLWTKGMRGGGLGTRIK